MLRLSRDTLLKNNLLDESPFINFMVDCLGQEDFAMPNQLKKRVRRAFKSHLLRLANQMVLLQSKDSYLEETLSQSIPPY